MYKNRNIKRILIVFSSLSILLISFGLLFNRSNDKNNNVDLSSQTQSVQLNNEPTKISGIKQISLGWFHSMILTKTGQVYTYGRSNNGQLGNGTKDTVSDEIKRIPQNITSHFKGLTGKIVQIASGHSHLMALTDSNQVYTWGWNEYGQLGDGTNVVKTSPTNITSKFNNEKIIFISSNAASNHSAALSSSNKIYTWGRNNYGQLGNGDEINQTSPVDITTNFENLNNEKITQISLGRSHSAALTDTNQVYTWGRNINGQLGNNGANNNANVVVPKKITSFFNITTSEKIIQILLGANHSAALSSTNQVYTWGDNLFGQIGNGIQFVDIKTPQKITSNFVGLEGQITQISMGEDHSIALSSTNQVYTWGKNDNGQIGNGTKSDQLIEFKSSPVDITSHFKNLNNSKIIQVSLGGFHSAALSSSGQLYMWGYNRYSQLGNKETGNTLSELAPILIADTPSIPTPSPTNIGAIVGGVIGGLVVLGLIGGLTFFFIKKKNDPNFRMPSFKKK